SLVEYFIRRWNESNTKKIDGIAPEALDSLYHHAWPGNIRELKNCIERAIVITSASMIRPEDIQIGSHSAEPSEAARSSSVPTAPAPAQSAAAASMEAESSGQRNRPASPISADLSDLNPRQVEVLQILKTRPGITTAEYMLLLRVSERTGLRDLADLVQRNVLSRHGRTRGAVYRLKAPVA